MRVPKVVRNTLLSIVIMVVLFVGAAVVYVLMADGQNKSAAVSPPKPTAYPQPKPAMPAANAPEGVALESLDSPVAAGQNTSMSIRTNPDSTCQISVTYGKIVSHDSGLTPKSSDVYGFVTWSWTVDPNVPAGTYPAKVTCVYSKDHKSGMVIGNLQVTK